MEVRLVAHASAKVADPALGAAYDRIEALEAVLSDWRPTSELSRLGDHPTGTWIPVSAPLFAVLSRALEIAAATDGAFDPTVGPLTTLWREARRTGRPVPDAALAEARTRVGWRLVSLDTAERAIRFGTAGMRLDLGAIAKGWILDRALAVLDSAGVHSALIEAGGDIVVSGPPPGMPGWRIAVRGPSGDSILVVQHAAVATSGPAAQTITDPDGTVRSHVIDPHDGRGSTSSLQVTVVGPDGATADALATAFTLVPRERWGALEERFGVRVVGTNERRET
jgi:thiamine biosynthesis lipoprotein